MAKKICVSETGGKYLGVFEDSEPQEAYIEVGVMPEHGFDIWDYGLNEWIPYVEPYDVKRKQEYPPTGDQTIQLWNWAMANGLVPDTSPGRDLDTPEGMVGEIEIIKATYPEP